MSNFGAVLSTNRQRRGLTLEAVARKVGSVKGYISRLERGKVAPPSPALCQRFAALYGLDAEDMIELAWATKAPKRIRARVMERIADNPLLSVRLEIVGGGK